MANNITANRSLRTTLTQVTQWLGEHMGITRPRIYNGYLTLVSIVGGGLVIYGLVQSITYTPITSFLLFVALVFAATFATTSAPISEQAGITYTINEALSIAVIPIWGVGAACILSTVSSIAVWFMKPANANTWKKSGQQLAFNTGMVNISIVCAGGVLLVTRTWLGPETLLGQSLPWLFTAIVYSEANLWLLLIILRLQHGPGFNSWKAWREEQWATQIEVLVLTIGGGLLAYAATHYGQLGILIFFVPILLSAYAFRLYVGQMQTHLENLEQMISERTSELAASKTQVESHAENLAELNRQKDAYLTVLTHDMITPLSSMQMLVELIKKRPEAAEENPRIADLMIRNQKTLFNIVHNILDVEKLRAGEELSSNIETCSLNNLVDEITEVVGAEARAKTIQLTCQLDESMPLIDADHQQLERVLLNLVSNAIKYTPREGKVTVKTMALDESVQLQVQDTGYGIPKDELSQIFERFHRVGQLRDKATGTGLGLTITKVLVEKHNGTITVTSTEGVGTTATVRFPKQPIQEFEANHQRVLA